MNARSAAPIATSAAALALAVAGCGGGGPQPPVSDATKLVPRDALVYVHLSTDTSRGATKQALAAARRFSGFDRLRRSVVSRLSAPGCRVQTGKGKEAALALLDSRSGTAGSLVLVDSGDDKPAPERNCGAVRVAKIGRFTVIGQEASIGAARRLAAGKGTSLADAPGYRRGLSRLPADRVADAYVTGPGVRRLLAPQNGLLGIVGVLLDRPGLRSASASLGMDGAHRARIVIAEQAAASKPSPQDAPFEPRLQDEVPADAFAYVGSRGLQGVGARLLTQVPGGIDAAALRRIFSGEVALALTYAVPAPVLTIIAQTRDARTARRALGKVGLRTALVDGKVVASTRASGITAVRSAKRHLPDTAAWAAVEPKAPKQVGSLVFLDFTQLLRLAEKTGLSDNAAYRAVRGDLERVRSVGARSSGTGGETTAEILLSIP